MSTNSALLSEETWIKDIGLIILGAVVSFFSTVITMRSMFVGRDTCKLCKENTAKVETLTLKDLQRQLNDLKKTQETQGELLFTVSGQMSFVADYVKDQMQR